MKYILLLLIFIIGVLHYTDVVRLNAGCYIMHFGTVSMRKFCEVEVYYGDTIPMKDYYGNAH